MKVVITGKTEKEIKKYFRVLYKNIDVFFNGIVLEFPLIFKYDTSKEYLVLGLIDKVLTKIKRLLYKDRYLMFYVIQSMQIVRRNDYKLAVVKPMVYKVE